MTVKIIKPYQVREGKTWPVGQEAEVTNDFGKYLIDNGFAHELKIEKRKDKKGNEYEVQIEVFDKSAQRIVKNIEKTKA